MYTYICIYKYIVYRVNTSLFGERNKVKASAVAKNHKHKHKHTSMANDDDAADAFFLNSHLKANASVPPPLSVIHFDHLKMAL